MTKKWLCPFCKKELVKVPARIGGKSLCSCGSLLHRMGYAYDWGDPDNTASKEAAAKKRK